MRQSDDTSMWAVVAATSQPNAVSAVRRHQAV
jgi:hypothetical protein